MAYLTRDVWVGMVMLAVSILYWIEADKIRISPLDGPVGASGLPKTLAYALGALAIAMILRSLVAAMGAPATKAEGDVPEDAPSARRRHLKAVGMLGIGVAYLLVIPFLGYAVTVAALLLAVSVYIGAPLGLKSILVAAIGAVVFQLLFVVFLDIPLPQGALVGGLLSAI